MRRYDLLFFSIPEQKIERNVFCPVREWFPTLRVHERLARLAFTGQAMSPSNMDKVTKIYKSYFTKPHTPLVYPWHGAYKGYVCRITWLRIEQGLMIFITSQVRKWRSPFVQRLWHTTIYRPAIDPWRTFWSSFTGATDMSHWTDFRHGYGQKKSARAIPIAALFPEVTRKP